MVYVRSSMNVLCTYLTLNHILINDFQRKNTHNIMS